MTPIEAAREAAREAMSQSLSDEAAYIMGSGEYQCNAAIAAYEAALSAQGLVIVPKEATVEMFRALTESWIDRDRAAIWALGSFAEDYTAMISAYQEQGE